jgi:ribosomal protein L37AE/L43A
MKTSEDASRSGLYASECCGAELVFYKGDTLWRCPICHHLCNWELMEGAFTPDEIEAIA